ncbi:hypothetical protein FNI11_05765 [Salmonella enterica subsp. salamae]|nr:hypothetical protein [Salmonella enterica subsp. salamae]ECJ2280422.1 hypothetical protein [Salmonella enterica subsp. salamae]
MRNIPVPHRRQPSAVHIRSGRICHGVAAFLQLELFRVYTQKKAVLSPLLVTTYFLCLTENHDRFYY